MYLTPSCVPRMTSDASGVHTFHIDFMEALLVTSSKHWVSTLDRCGMNVFDQYVLPMSHDTNAATNCPLFFLQNTLGTTAGRDCMALIRAYFI